MVMKRQFEPGESEFSWGRGLMPNVKYGYVPEQIDVLRAERRTDPTDPASTVNYDDLGNPDRFGPQPPLQGKYVKHPASNFDAKNPLGIKGKPYTGKVRREP